MVRKVTGAAAKFCFCGGQSGQVRRIRCHALSRHPPTAALQDRQPEDFRIIARHRAVTAGLQLINAGAYRVSHRGPGQRLSEFASNG